MTVFLLALLVRVGYLLFHYQDVGAALPYSDGRAFDNYAINMLSGFGYNIDGFPDFSTLRTPGHPLFLAFVYYYGGHSPFLARLVQVLLSALTVILIFLIGQNLFSYVVGVLAGLLAAIYMPYVHRATSLYSETVGIFCLTLFVYFVTKVGKVPSLANLIKLGLAFGVAVLVRGTYAVLLPLLPLVLLLKGKSLSETVKALTLFLVTALIVIAPWLIRNYLLHGRFIFSSQGGITIYMASQGIGYDRKLLDDIYWNPRFVNLSEAERDRLLSHLAIQNILRRPTQYMAYCLRRLSDFWHPRQFFEAESRLLIFPFMLIGALVALIRRQQGLPLLYVIISITFIHSLLQAHFPYGPRYRLQIEWCLVLFAGLGLVTIMKLIQRRIAYYGSFPSEMNAENVGIDRPQSEWMKFIKTGAIISAMCLVGFLFYRIAWVNIFTDCRPSEPLVPEGAVARILTERGLSGQWRQQGGYSISLSEVLEYKRRHGGKGEPFYGSIFIWDGKINYIEREKAHRGNGYKRSFPCAGKTVFWIAVNAFSKPHYAGDFRIYCTYHGQLDLSIKDGDRVKVLGVIRCDGDKKRRVMVTDIYGVF